MTTQPPYPNGEELVRTLLDTSIEDLTTGTATPDDLTGKLPFGRVRRLGGSDDGLTDTSLVDVDTFVARAAGAYTVGVDLAELVRQLLTSGPHHQAAGVIDRVITTTAPVERPWPDEKVLRRTGTYAVTVRRRSTRG